MLKFFKYSVTCSMVLLTSFAWTWGGGAPERGSEPAPVRYMDNEAKLLHLGDSQTDGSFGAALHAFLESKFKKEEIRMLGVSGSSVRHWAQNKRKEDAKWLCDRHGRVGTNRGWAIGWEVCRQADWISPFSEANVGHPSKVVFQFLGNSSGRSKEFIREQVDLLLSQLKEEQNCFFLTSPPFHRDLDERNTLRQETEDSIVEAVGDRCRVNRGMRLEWFKDRRDFYVNDKIHLSDEGARAWLEAVKGDLAEFLAE